MLRLDDRELRLEILIAFGVGLVRHDGSTQGLERLGEVVREPDAVVVLVVPEDRRLGEPEGAPPELGDHLALERVDEADAGDVIPQLGHLGVGRGRGDHGDARLLADGSRRHAPAGRDLSQNRDHAVLIHQLVHRSRRLFRLGLVVFDDHANLDAADPAAGVDVVHVELDPILGRGPERGGCSRQRAVLADDDLVLALGAAQEQGRDSREGDYRAIGHPMPDHPRSSMA